MADTAARPRGWQYVRYCYGAVLPDSMRAWVANDLAGKGAPMRMVVRWAIPCIILMLPMLFVPCLLYTSPSPRDGLLSRMPSSA